MAITVTLKGTDLKFDDGNTIQYYPTSEVKQKVVGSNIEIWRGGELIRSDNASDYAKPSGTAESIGDAISLLSPKTGGQGAFGDLITSHKSPIVQISNRYQIDPANLDYMEIFEATGGSADNDTNMFRCQTGTSVGGYGVVRSTETINYRPGQGVECQITASFTAGVPLSLQFAGMFSLTETLAFGYDGANFSCLHSYNGAAEVQLITVTATGAGTCNVTLDNDVVGITVTNSDVQTNAEELRAGLAGDPTIGAKWRFEQIDDKVYCISKSVGDKTGTFSISGGVTASIVEKTAGVAKTDNHTAQSSWNLDIEPFSGFDPTKLNSYKIQFGYLGVANITYSIYNPNNGEFIAVHQIEWANSNTTPHLGSPNLKAGWTSASLGSSGTNLTVKGASASIMLEGDEVIKNNTFADESTVASVGTTLTNLITIKNRIVFGDRFNLGKAFPLLISVNNDHNKGAIVEIIRNATVGGTPNYQYQDEYNSIVIADKAGTTVSGGTLIDAFTVGAALSEDIDLSNLFTELLPEDTFTIAAKTVSGTSTSMTATIAWKEEK